MLFTVLGYKGYLVILNVFHICTNCCCCVVEESNPDNKAKAYNHFMFMSFLLLLFSLLRSLLLSHVLSYLTVVLSHLI